MAPQNSTLIRENTELTSELSRYSPILALTNSEEIWKWTENEFKKGEKSNDVHQQKSIASNNSSSSGISLQGDEVPIWICGEPRFISGVTKTTTCTQIIQALIDDELNCSNPDVAASRDLNDYVITEKWRDVEQELPGDTNILPIWVAWGDARNEVKFKLKINKNKAGTRIVSSGYDDGGDYEKKQVKKVQKKKKHTVTNLLRRIIYQGEYIREHLAVLSEKSNNNKRKQLKECQKQKPDLLSIESSLQHSDSMSELNPLIRESRDFLHSTASAPDDELFLLIDSNSGLAGHGDSGVHVEYRQYYLNKKLSLAMAAKASQKCQQNTISETPKLGKYARGKLRENPLNKQLAKHFYTIGNSLLLQETHNHNEPLDSVHREIAVRMSEIYQLICYEQDLLKSLTLKCEQYRNQNKIYTTKLGLEMCIDEVQRNLDSYAKEIIENELALYEIKLEIRQKCGILYNLQRLLKSDSDRGDTLKSTDRNASFTSNNDNNFFCDISDYNNKSIII